MFILLIKLRKMNILILKISSMTFPKLLGFTFFKDFFQAWK